MSAVLIIEDDARLRESLRELLEDSGHRVTTASNGREALDSLDQGSRPSLILLDLMMPVMNGWEFREAQVKRADLARIPVVVLTADGSAEKHLQDLGVSGVVRKPLDVERLLELITRFG